MGRIIRTNGVVSCVRKWHDRYDMNVQNDCGTVLAWNNQGLAFRSGWDHLFTFWMFTRMVSNESGNWCGSGDRQWETNVNRLEEVWVNSRPWDEKTLMQWPWGTEVRTVYRMGLNPRLLTTHISLPFFSLRYQLSGDGTQPPSCSYYCICFFFQNSSRDLRCMGNAASCIIIFVAYFYPPNCFFFRVNFWTHVMLVFSWFMDLPNSPLS